MSETFGERLRRLRKKHNLLQEALAARVGVCKQNLGKWENDLHHPDFDRIPALSRALNVTTDYLLTGRDPDDALRNAILRGTSREILLAMARREM